MPRTAEDIETFLQRLNRPYEIDRGTWLVSTGPETPRVAIRVAGPIVALRVDIGRVPQDEAHQVRLFRKLLEYNASDLLHASYGISDGQIVLSAAHEMENLDPNELDATLSDMDLALVRHIGDLKALAEG
jgi:hypothetical protein